MPHLDHVSAGPTAPRTSRPLAAVTGAGGSLGRALVRALHDDGWAVRGLVRRDHDAEALAALGADSVVGDVEDQASLERLVAGAQVVHHLAAWMGGAGGLARARAVNVEGTRRVLRAAAAVGARRIVLASSIAVYGPVRDGRVDETRPPWRVGDPYGDTKIEAEEVAREEAQRTGIELVVLRPTMIYGPRSPSWTEIPFRSIARGLPVVLGDGEDLLDAVYVDDVARAFVLAARVPEAAGQSFTIGGAPVTWNAFMGAYARMARRPLRRLPAGLAWGGARAAAAITRPLLGRPAVVPEMVGVMTSRATFPHDKARSSLGYEPRVGLDEGMQRTLRWLRGAGVVRTPTTALVTGAAGGLGQAVVAALVDRGVLVYAADVDAGGTEALAGDRVRPLALDVTSDESVRAALEMLDDADPDGEGGVDLLVNAAGILLPGSLEEQTMSDVERQFAVNALGPLRLVRALAPGMRRRGFGRIVNVSSTNGFLVTPFMGAYSASKFALEALSDALRLEMAPWGIEVTVIQPGSMRTRFAGKAKAALRSEIERSPEWARYLENLETGSLWGEAQAADPATVARRIAAAALAPRMGPRRFGTFDAVATRVFAMLPDTLKDAFFMRAVGLRRRRDR